MSTTRIKQMREIVVNCLKEDSTTRNSDWRLYEVVCNKLGLDSKKITLHDIATNPKIFPTFETVSRCRRKAQENGLFVANKTVQDYRVQQYFDFKEGMK